MSPYGKVLLVKAYVFRKETEDKEEKTQWPMCKTMLKNALSLSVAEWTSEKKTETVTICDGSLFDIKGFSKFLYQSSSHWQFYSKPT